MLTKIALYLINDHTKIRAKSSALEKYAQLFGDNKDEQFVTK